ncbi:hypothetical protein EPZ47_09935 [Pseudomonas viciae]|uniref:Uncharacterized protein n=1 Tax=Pseudomonas viciae TaxID=2505979 RepID=A0A4P7PEG9_9PSED|nr:hypothetical protein EPZ47_09935 [Pseudomonas viciae]
MARKVFLWEQDLPARQAPRFLSDRVVFIAGKPCSHTSVPPLTTVERSSARCCGSSARSRLGAVR